MQPPTISAPNQINTVYLFQDFDSSPFNKASLSILGNIKNKKIISGTIKNFYKNNSKMDRFNIYSFAAKYYRLFTYVAHYIAMLKAAII